ncbi:MAG: putative porin [Bacteroidota bacterium]
MRYFILWFAFMVFGLVNVRGQVDSLAVKVKDTTQISPTVATPESEDTILPGEKQLDSLATQVKDSTQIGPIIARPEAEKARGQKEMQLDSLAITAKDSTQTGPISSKLKGENAAEEEKRELTIANYKIISHQRDTIILDTSLTIQKEYRYNFLRKDDFELMPFSNLGQPYNSLGVDFEAADFYPDIGARARHFGFFETEDINYYNVGTPMTELFFKTTLEQGQLLDALLTFNLSERLNISLAYIGFRSLGKFEFDQGQSGRFRATFNYVTQNNRYMVRGHYAGQELDGEENGGLLNKELQFESGDEDFDDRSRIDVLFTNANNTVNSKRYFLDHQFNLVRPRKDSLKTRTTTLAIGHQFSYETKSYSFNQTSTSAAFGTEVLQSPIRDKAFLRTTYNQLSAIFSNKTLGRLSGGFHFYNYDYSLKSILIRTEGTVPGQLKGSELALGGDYQNRIGGFELKGKLRYNLAGDLTGTLFDVSAGYAFNDNNRIEASIYGSSRMPNFNFLLHQSDYLNYNWFNLDNYEKQQVQSIGFRFVSSLLGSASAKLTNIDNYTYFGLEGGVPGVGESEVENNSILLPFVRPFQTSESLQYLKVKYQKELRWRKWALNNTVMYQQVSQEGAVFNVPEIVTRNTLYFSSEVFKKAMFIQTGVTFKYFTAYAMDAYNPLLGEFYVQNRETLGAYPLIDFFINARVRQTRIYLKAEHLNTVWDREFNYYAAPNYPYRDFVIRFGLVWNFFS